MPVAGTIRWATGRLAGFWLLAWVFPLAPLPAMAAQKAVSVLVIGMALVVFYGVLKLRQMQGLFDVDSPHAPSVRRRPAAACFCSLCAGRLEGQPKLRRLPEPGSTSLRQQEHGGADGE